MSSRHNVTLEAVYKKMMELQRDLMRIKKSLLEDPELREEFVVRMRKMEPEKSIPVRDFGKRYGLK